MYQTIRPDTLGSASDSLGTFSNGWWSYVTYGLPAGSPARREVVARAYQSASVYARGAALGARAALWNFQNDQKTMKAFMLQRDAARDGEKIPTVFFALCTWYHLCASCHGLRSLIGEEHGAQGWYFRH